MKLGPSACPFNYLYWNFLIENATALASNPRMAMPYRTLARMPAEQRAEIVRSSAAFLDRQHGWKGDESHSTQPSLDDTW